MRAELVNPFVRGTGDVLTMLLSTTPTLGKITAESSMVTSGEVNVACGVTGDLTGQVILSLSETSATKLATKMMGGAPVDDALRSSCLSELANMVCGNSVTLLAEAKFACDITPPTLISGTNVKITAYDLPCLIIPIEIAEVGTLSIHVCLKDRKAAVAAA
jgi:chemotaxis protein CheX